MQKWSLESMFEENGENEEEEKGTDDGEKESQ